MTLYDAFDHAARLTFTLLPETTIARSNRMDSTGYNPDSDSEQICRDALIRTARRDTNRDHYDG